MDRRSFLEKMILSASVCGINSAIPSILIASPDTSKKYDSGEHLYGMGIDINKCIGCGKCVDACKTENSVPREPQYNRTWVERYFIKKDGKVVVENINQKSGQETISRDVIRSFTVPKLCNHCAKAPCVQVCPVNATFITDDGVVLVDEKRCVGCRYCIQACPYGARFLNPVTKTADKCTFCYHRIVRGLRPACVEVCPTQARVFGDLKSPASTLTRFKRMNNIHVLKPYLNTEPKVLYANLDGEVN